MNRTDRPYEGTYRDNSQRAQQRGDFQDLLASTDLYYYQGKRRVDTPAAWALNVIRGGANRHHWTGGDR